MVWKKSNCQTEVLSLCCHSSEVLMNMTELCFFHDHQMKLGLRLWSYVREEASYGRVIQLYAFFLSWACFYMYYILCWNKDAGKAQNTKPN
jgi:hypothetical protein